ncbi:MAG: hypothetical protein NXH82_03795 [Rhodobacteraceae bacterium]|nr:hypothetical protein [Paracoccaceae bacterium]
MYLVLTAILFGAYVVNVVLGSISGTPFLGDVSEMLLLFAASICFVVAILRSERKARQK